MNVVLKISTPLFVLISVIFSPQTGTCTHVYPELRLGLYLACPCLYPKNSLADWLDHAVSIYDMKHNKDAGGAVELTSFRRDRS